MRRSVERIGMGLAVRIVLRLREPFWADDPPKAWRNGRAGHPRDLAFLHVPGRDFPTWWTAAPSETPMLTGWAGGPAASALARLPPTKIPDRALGTLSAIFGMPHERLARLLVGWHVHDWGADPYSRGAYSFTAVGGASAPEDLSRPVARTLYFAGEATARGKTGTVPGAIASGERAARQILREG